MMAAPKSKKTPLRRVQTLGSHTYALPDVVLDNNNNNAIKSSSWHQQRPVVQLVVMTIMSPVWLMAAVGYNVVMLLGPRAIKEKILSMVIPRLMGHVKSKTRNQRTLLLQHVHGRVLDVGSGGGAYMTHLSPSKGVTHVVALEPIHACHAIIRKEAERAGLATFQVTIRPDTLEDYCRYVQTSSSSSNDGISCTEQFDWIILGNVLCEVPDVPRALDYVNQLLRPGGHVYFQEHVGCDAGSWKRKLQNTMNPWWKRISGGCNCNRDSLFAIEGMAQWDVVSWECSNLKVMMGPMVMGLACKAAVV